MFETVEEIVRENRKRHDMMFGEYDPVTGIGCYGFGNRVCVEIADMIFPRMFVPNKCLDNMLFGEVVKLGSVRKYIEEVLRKPWTMALHNMLCLQLCKLRAREDPEFGMYLTDKIVDKVSGEMIPFRLNYPQRKLLRVLEDLRAAGRPIYVIILKARQWGGSTLSQMYIKWMHDFRHPNGWNAIILSQVKDTSKKIKAMYRKAIELQPGWSIDCPGVSLKMSPFENSQNDFVVTDGNKALRSSTLSIASFDNFDNVRGSNFHCAHFSEVAYWKKTPEHDPEAVISSISGGILGVQDDIEIFESSGRGASGFFYDRCQSAMDPENHDAYRFLFIPFFDIENNTKSIDDKEKFAIWLLKNRNSDDCPKGYKESGKFFWRLWTLGATFEAINWYRETRNKYKSHSYFSTEAPVDEVEAFRNSGNLVFNQYSIDEMQSRYKREPKYVGRIDLPVGKEWQNDKGTKYLNQSKIVLGQDGGLKIWNLPNNEVLKIRNRYLVSVDIGGRSPKSDFTVMTVIDRKGLIDGINGTPQVVARWRGHVRHDILAWKAAALAKYYDKATLVIESNTADRDKANTEGDHFGTIIEEIGNVYENMYQRKVGPENVIEKQELKYGFQTNKLTKGWLIDNMIACVDDCLWDEPDKEMYHELRIYERRDDGSLGNIVGAGNHDDVLMSTAIGLWIAVNDMEKPCWMYGGWRKKKTKEEITEATF